MKKNILTIVVVIITLFLTLCGCTELSQNSYKESETSTSQIKKSDVNTPKENESETNQDMENSIICFAEPLGFFINNETNLNDELIKHIKLSKTVGEEDENYLLYTEHKISDIKEFYNLDNLKIEGYKLYRVIIFEGAFGFRFAPIENLEKENEHVNLINGKIIEIRIEYPNGWFNKLDPLEVFDIRIEQAENQGWGSLTEDYMIYSAEHGDISTLMNDTIVSIVVPNELNTYEYLRDLVFQVIKTAELVKVE